MIELTLFCVQAKAVAQPFAYEEYRKEQIRKKIEESQASKIRLKVGVCVSA